MLISCDELITFLFKIMVGITLKLEKLTTNPLYIDKLDHPRALRPDVAIGRKCV